MLLLHGVGTFQPHVRILVTGVVNPDTCPDWVG
jgi:hypothetical protein